MTNMVVSKPELQREYSVEREALIQNYCKVIEEINITNTHLLGYLIEKMVLNQSEKEYISNGETYKARNERLVDILIKKHRPEAINMFVKALEDDHDWLAKHIRASITAVKRQRFNRQRSPAIVPGEGDNKRDTTEEKRAAHLSKERTPVESEFQSLPEASARLAFTENSDKGFSNQQFATGADSKYKTFPRKQDATTQMSNNIHTNNRHTCEGKSIDCFCCNPSSSQQGHSDLNLQEDIHLDSDSPERQPFISHPSSFKGEPPSWQNRRPNNSQPVAEGRRDSKRLSDGIGYPSQVSSSVDENQDEEASIKRVVPSSQRAQVETSMASDSGLLATTELPSELNLCISLREDQGEIPPRTEGHIPRGYDEIPVRTEHTPHGYGEELVSEEGPIPHGNDEIPTGAEGNIPHVCDDIPEDSEGVMPLEDDEDPSVPEEDGASPQSSLKRSRALRVRPVYQHSVSAVETSKRAPLTPPVVHSHSADGPDLFKQSPGESGICSKCSKPLRRTASSHYQGEAAKISHCTCAIKRKNSDQLRVMRPDKMGQSQEFVSYGLQLFNRDKSTLHERSVQSHPVTPNNAEHRELEKQPSRNTHEGIFSPQSGSDKEEENDRRRSENQAAGGILNENATIDGDFFAYSPDGLMQAAEANTGPQQPSASQRRKMEAGEEKKGTSLPRKVSDTAGLDMLVAQVRINSKTSRKSKKRETVQAGIADALATSMVGLIDSAGSEELSPPSMDNNSMQKDCAIPNGVKMNASITTDETKLNLGQTKTNNPEKKRPLCRTEANSISNSSLESSMVEGCYDVVLQRHSEHGFGFKFISGKGERARFPGDEDYFITKIIPGSPAEKEPQLAVNDTIISINGVNIRNKEHEDVCQLFKQAGEIRMVLRINQESELM